MLKLPALIFEVVSFFKLGKIKAYNKIFQRNKKVLSMFCLNWENGWTNAYDFFKKLTLSWPEWDS